MVLRRTLPPRTLVHAPGTRVLAALLCLCLVLGAQPVPAAHAATRTVTNTANHGPGSLRRMINLANAGDEIIFDPGVTGTIALTGGQIVIEKDLTITGPGESILTVSGEGFSRVFRIPFGDYDVTISGLTIANGISIADRGGGLYNRSTGTVHLQRVTFKENEADRGGGMFNWGTGDVTLEQVTFETNDAYRGGGMLNRFCNPTLTNVTFNSNTATGYGGGMHNNGSSPTLTDVVFSDNSATLRGGGMYNEGNSVPALTDVTFSENGAEYGGGMYNDDSSPTLTNVTFSGNSAASDGGGIWNSADSNPILTHVTISGNSAVVGGGLFSESDPATPTLSNTILAGNTAVFGPDCYGAIVSGNYNLVENPTDCDFVIQANDQIGADPLLGPLADNGGETQTRALLIGSPAIDAIPFGFNGCGITVTSDQRGEDRPYPAGGYCDIGAYEYIPPALPDTGFAPGALTTLAEQPAEKAYTLLGDLWLELPDLGVQAPIVGVPFVGGGWDVSWLGSSAGYLPGSAFPTWPGNTVLTGHVWDAHNRPGIFVDLQQLRYDDRIAIHAWGATYLYAVRESRLVAPQAVDIVMQHKELDWVTLLTCEDYRFDSEGYIFRRMVRAVLVDVVPDR